MKSVRRSVQTETEKHRKGTMEGDGGDGTEKVNWTLAEALISSRLHRPRSEPLGASLPSN